MLNSFFNKTLIALNRLDSTCTDDSYDYLPPLGAPVEPSSVILSTMKVIVLRSMHTRFGQNLPRTFREDVKNINFAYMTLYMTICKL